MKTSNIMKSALALALGLCASGALAVSQDAAREDFQGDAFANGVNTVATNNLTWADTDQYSYVDSGKLVVDATTNAPTSATLDSDAATSVNGAINAAGRTASFEAKVSFTPATDTPDIGGSDLRFALYAKAGSGSTNLVVYTGSETVTTTEIAANTETTVKVDFTAANTFQVYIGGNLVAGGPFAFANNGTISKVEFAGNGEVDDLVFSYDLVDTTITWPTTLSVVSYTVDGEPGDALTASAGTYTVSTEPGAAIVITGTTPYGATVTASGTAGTGFGVTTTTSDIGWYFPQTATAGQNGTAEHPFEIANATGLSALKEAFSKITAARAYAYKITADIDATDLGYWDGIGAQGTANSGLKGVLDGDGHTISNLKLSAGKYRAFFNRMDNATIKNLTINVTDIQASGDEYGFAAFVGNMDSSKLLNCTATGTIGTTAKPTKHTCAGFAVKVNSAGVFVNCTNHIDIVCSLQDNPKIGGIVGLMQGGALTNCYNDGAMTITCKKVSNAANGAGGLIGYTQTGATTIHACGNAGTIQSTNTTADGGSADVKIGTIIAMANKTVTVSGGTIAQADAKSAAAIANITGLKFATVSGNVATFVADTALAAGNTYKVMADGVQASYNFTAAGTIAFNTALATPTYNITAPGLNLTSATDGSVTTYTAAATQNYGDDEGELPAVNVSGESNHTLTEKEADYLNAYVSNGKSNVEIADKLAGTSKAAFEEAALLNQDIFADGYAAGSYSFNVTKVKRESGNVKVTVELDRTYALANTPINGTLVLKFSSDGGKTFSEASKITFDGSAFGSGDEATFTFSASGNGMVFKAVIE